MRPAGVEPPRRDRRQRPTTSSSSRPRSGEGQAGHRGDAERQERRPLHRRRRAEPRRRPAAPGRPALVVGAPHAVAVVVGVVGADLEGERHDSAAATARQPRASGRRRRPRPRCPPARAPRRPAACGAGRRRPTTLQPGRGRRGGASRRQGGASHRRRGSPVVLGVPMRPGRARGPGQAFVDALQRAWDDGDAVLPLDPRLPGPAVAPAAVPFPGRRRRRRPGRPSPAASGRGRRRPGRRHQRHHRRAQGRACSPTTRWRPRPEPPAGLGVDPATDRWLACLPLAHVGGLSVVTRALVTGTPLDGARRVRRRRRWSTPPAERRARSRPSCPPPWPAHRPVRLPARSSLGGQAPPDGLPAQRRRHLRHDRDRQRRRLRRRPARRRRGAASVDGEIHVRGADAAPGLPRRHRPARSRRLVPHRRRRRAPRRPLLGARPARRPHHHRRRERVAGRGRAGAATTPGVAEVAVVGRPDPEWGQVVAAVVVPADPAGPPTLGRCATPSRPSSPPTPPRRLELVDVAPPHPLGKVRPGPARLSDHPGRRGSVPGDRRQGAPLRGNDERRTETAGRAARTRRGPDHEPARPAQRTARSTCSCASPMRGTAIEADPTVRCAVLTGAGGHYCVGGDLSSGWMAGGRARRARPSERRAQEDPALIAGACCCSTTCRVPVIAAVNGDCMGGGCEMLQQTDIRIAEEHARFGVPEVQRGLIAGAGSTMRLKRQIPYAVGAWRCCSPVASSTPRKRCGGAWSPTSCRSGQALAKAREIAEVIAPTAPSRRGHQGVGDRDRLAARGRGAAHRDRPATR